MNENSINSNIETGLEEVNSAVFSSKFLMTKDLYYDFCSVSYNRTKRVFLAFLCLVAFLIPVNLLAGNCETVLGFGPFISFLMVITYLRTKKEIQISYERNLISAGKVSTLNYELYEDRIVSYLDELRKEHFYHQITKLFETKNFIMLHLQHNLYITIEKNSLHASVDEVKSFLIEKCTLVKKKKFINCCDDKKWSLVFLTALIVISAAGTMIGLVLKVNALF
ncbi:MAG: YcxB family protein [Hominenteromicrobium sp.]